MTGKACPRPRAGSIGWVVGESTPQTSTVLLRRSTSARTGMFVLAENGEGCLLGVVERVEAGHALLDSRLTDHSQVENALQYEDVVRGQVYWRARVRWLSLLEPLESGGRLVGPTMPVEPPGEVWPAPDRVLERIFQGGRGWIRLGVLARNPSVEYHINVNKLTRHLAILAVTGGGKSNTVNILAHRIVSELGGTIVIFDIHGEYITIAERLAPGRWVRKEPRINPYRMSLEELKTLARLPEGAHVQERILRLAWKNINSPTRSQGQNLLDPNASKTLLERLSSEISRVGKKIGAKPDSINGILNRVDDIQDYYGDVLDENYHTDLTMIIEPGKLNIFDLSSVDENGADAVVSHYLRRILEERKRWKWTRGEKGYPVPVLVVVEEAHILIPRDRSTLTKYWASRIAREGRKFGVGLVLVSQRPKNVDPDVLSQTNNKIILRIVEPTDQRYVQAASEQLSEDLVQLLPSLNPGEAIVIGSMTRLPALVKIDHCAEICGAQPGGADIDLVGEWSRYNTRAREGSFEEELTSNL